MTVTTMSPAPPASGAQGWLAFAGCSAIWGSTFLVIRIGNESVPPMWAATIRLALASVILVTICWSTGRALPRGAALVAAARFGFLNFGLNFSLLYWGEAYVPSGITAVVYGIIPLTTALFARAFGLERLNPLKLGAALVAFAGVAAIFSGQIRANVPALPMLAVVASATCASLSSVMLKLGPRQHALGANAVGCLVGLPVCLAGSVLAGEPRAFPDGWAAWFPILYLTVAGSVGAFVLYAWLLGRWDVTRASFIAVVVPVVALLLGTVFYGERVPPASVVGVVLVFTALALGIAADRLKR